MKIQVKSKRSFSDYLKENNINNKTIETFFPSHWFICINGTVPGEENKPFLESRLNVLNLFFDDIDEDILIKVFYRNEQDEIESKNHTCKSFDSNNANETIRFLTLISHFAKKEENINLIIHCHAGISRSGAIGVFANDFLGLKYEDFKQENPHVLPNSKVLRELNKVIWLDSL